MRAALYARVSTTPGNPNADLIAAMWLGFAALCVVFLIALWVIRRAGGKL